MLDYHRNDQNIFLIGGYNKQSWKTFYCDYFYSHLVVYGGGLHGKEHGDIMISICLI